TISAARSGESSKLWAVGGAVKRSGGAISAAGRGTGRGRSRGTPPGPGGVTSSGGRGTGVRPGSSVIELLGVVSGRRCSPRGLQATRRRLGRDDARLAERYRQGPQRDLARIEGEHSVLVHRTREAVHAPRCRSVLRAQRLDAKPVIARAVAGAFEPEVLQARVRLAAEMRAALVQGPHVDRSALAALVLAGQELLATRVDQDDEPDGVRHVGR